MPSSKPTKLDQWLLPPPSSSTSKELIIKIATPPLLLPDAAYDPVGNLPSFPVEILGLIFAACPKASLRSLLATSRTFRDLARSILFAQVSIRGGKDLPRLVGISHDHQIAPLVRTLSIAFPLSSDPNVSSWSNVTTTIADALPLFKDLFTFKLLDSPSDEVFLTSQLLRSILTHPSLVVVAYPKLWHNRNELSVVLRRNQKVGFVVQQLSYLHPDDVANPAMLPSFGSLLTRIADFAFQYNVRIRCLSVVRTVEGPNDPLFLLLAADLPHLQRVEVEFASEVSFPTSFGEWFKDLFAALPEVVIVELSSRLDEDFDGQKVYLPCESLMQVAGMKERVASKDMESWWSETPLRIIAVRFRALEDPDGGREVVVLSILQHPMADVTCCIDGEDLRGLAAQFPALETLAIRGAVYSTFHPYDLDYITQLTSFRHLVDVLLPVEYLTEPMSFCYHDYESLAQELEDERENGPTDEHDALDPDGRLFERLHSTGRLTRRDSPKDFVDRLRKDVITIASSLESLKDIELDVSIDFDLVGSTAWAVLRGAGGTVTLEEISSSEKLLEPQCTCGRSWMEIPFGEDLIDLLLQVPPLFERSSAGFEPAFTLDRFVVARR